MKQTFKLKKVSINDVTLSSLNLSNVSKPLDKTFLKEVRIILNKPLSLTLDNNVHCDGRDYKTINIDELEQKVDKTVYDLKDRKITKNISNDNKLIHDTIIKVEQKIEEIPIKKKLTKKLL